MSQAKFGLIAKNCAFTLFILMHAYIHFFSNHVLSVCCMPSTILGIGNHILAELLGLASEKITVDAETGKNPVKTHRTDT